MPTLVPIALFVYNRPWHTLQTLEALAQNEGANQSHLVIFSDGAKDASNKLEVEAIREVRTLIREKQWCSSVQIIERQDNWGLAQNIISGVTQLVQDFGKVIVLEDDIVTSQYFLKYMNDALNIYEKEEKVMHISGYMYPVPEPLPQTFFIYPASCWGWATWERAWKNYNDNAGELMETLRREKRISEFDFYNSFNHYEQLLANADGVLHTWAVKWYASIFINDGLSLHPYPSLVQNIGLDGSGTNIKTPMMAYNVALSGQKIESFSRDISLSSEVIDIIREYFTGSRKYKSIYGIYLRRCLSRLIPGFARKYNVIKKHLGFWN